ncbi:hypothetical protein GCM10022243_18260 [Saccharothrix violaceirubra]
MSASIGLIAARGLPQRVPVLPFSARSLLVNRRALIDKTGRVWAATLRPITTALLSGASPPWTVRPRGRTGSTRGSVGEPFLRTLGHAAPHGVAEDSEPGRHGHDE